jgi:hypothetical protein
MPGLPAFRWSASIIGHARLNNAGNVATTRPIPWAQSQTTIDTIARMSSTVRVASSRLNDVFLFTIFLPRELGSPSSENPQQHFAHSAKPL